MARRNKTEQEERFARAARLVRARRDAHFTGAQSAAKHFGWNVDTYKAHESGRNGFGIADAKKYAEAYGVAADWLNFGEDGPPVKIERPVFSPLVGHVGAGAQAVLFSEGQGPFGEVPAPPNATEKTVAVEIRGTSLGELFDTWLVFYDEVRDPPGGKQVGKLCVCGLADGRILVKKLQRGHLPGFWNLISNTEPPIYDVIVEWAAVVTSMTPRF